MAYYQVPWDMSMMTACNFTHRYVTLRGSSRIGARSIAAKAMAGESVLRIDRLKQQRARVSCEHLITALLYSKATK